MQDSTRSRILRIDPARIGLCAGLFVVAVLTLGANSLAADPSDGAYRDLQLMVHARKALREQDSLARLTIGIRVRDGIATVWGSVPAADLIPKAVKQVESVQGILGVRSELIVSAPEKDPLDLFIQHQPTQPMQSESASPDPLLGLPGSLTGRGIKHESVPQPAKGQAMQSVEPLRTEPDRPSVTSPPPEQPKISPLPAESLRSALMRVQRADARFRSLRMELRGDVVAITGTPDRENDVMAFARVVSRLPGVARVQTRTDNAGAP
jgi:osmotically-inducible protein OsmY